MKELTIEEKAKAYDKAIRIARELYNNPNSSEIGKEWLCAVFPELKESEDEKIRKEIIEYIKTGTYHKSWLTWLEKQGKSSVQIHYWTEEEIEPIISDYLRGAENYGGMIGRLRCLKPKSFEKQGRQEQLYIRFGEIPTDEKSKIYQGEIEVGIENGVSVYPAFKTNEGDIVLGLTLPITKTTLYTQQYLIEYDDRPCYLVKGDYVGKDTDGQPLISNVSIVEKIDSYRIKEEKQGEKPQGKSALEVIKEEKVDNQNYIKSADKVEPKFKVGDWVVDEDDNSVHQIKRVIENITNGNFSYDLIGGGYFPSIKKNYHLWSIKDAKKGDVIYLPNGNNEYYFFIFKGIENAAVMSFAHFYQYNDGTFEVKGTIDGLFSVNDVFQPATKEQRDTLLKAMTDAGYTFDFEKKELREIVAPIFHIGDRVRYKGHSCDGVITEITNTDYICGDAKLPILTQNKLELVEQKSAWSKEDEWKFTDILALLRGGENFHYNTPDLFEWLKSLKDRVQPKVEWSEKDEANLNEALSYIKDDALKEFIKSLRPQPKQQWSKEDEKIWKELIEEVKDQLDSIPAPDCRDKEDEKVLKQLNKWLTWLKSLRHQKQWKPTEIQITALENAANDKWHDKSILKELLEQLKQL